MEIASREHVELIVKCIEDNNPVSSTSAATAMTKTEGGGRGGEVASTFDDHLVMIFLNTADKAQKFAQMMRYIVSEKDEGSAQLECVEFHNLMSAYEKRSSLEQFRSGAVKVLVCTDSAARGLDLPEVRHVVEAQFALNVVQHLHRIGRASRAGRSGKATSFYCEEASPLVESIMGAEQDGRNIPVDQEGINASNASSIERSFSRRRGFRRNLKRKAQRYRN